MSLAKSSGPTPHEAAPQGNATNSSLTDALTNGTFDAALIASDPRIMAVDMAAYSRGYSDGHADAQITQEEQAQRAVRLFQAAQEDEERVRRDMAHTRDFIDVARRRADQRANVMGGAA